MTMPAAEPPVPPDEITAIPVRHWGRWVAAVVILAIAAWLAAAVVNSPAIHWATVRKFQFNHTILIGLRNTVVIAVLAQAVGLALGVAFAVMRLSTNPVTKVAAWFYIWFFRGTPVLV
jgi:polar amino acid transport system permease protein